jgi:hypothetical protein
MRQRLRMVDARTESGEQLTRPPRVARSGGDRCLEDVGLDVL